MPRKGENIRKRKDGRRAMKNVVTRMDGSSTDICMVVHTRL